MIVGVIGSGSIGPDLAYGFVTALTGEPGSKVYLVDIRKEALDAGVARIQGYVKKALARGKLSPKAAAGVEATLVPTLALADLAGCDYVLEAATEHLPVKRSILRDLEAVVRPDCLIGFATSGLPRKIIASEASDLDWLLRMSLGFTKGTLELAESLGADRVHELVTKHAARFPGFPVPPSVAANRPLALRRDLRVEKDGAIAVVRVVRPEVKNALCARTLGELEATIAELAADASVKGIVLTSTDGAFAGADINELAALKDPEACAAICRRGHAILATISACAKPVVAALDGPVLGGGAELSMACHARVVGEKLHLGQPEVDLGIIPGYGGTQRLPRLIGLDAALPVLRAGKSLDATAACKLGWATGKPEADVVAAAKALIGNHLEGKVKLAPVDPKPVSVPAELPKIDLGHRSLAVDGILVDVLRKGLALPLAEGLEHEALGFARCKRTVDMDIGMKNFMANGPRVPAVFLHE